MSVAGELPTPGSAASAQLEGDVACTEALATFVHDFRLEDVPAAVLERAKLLMLDSLGCALGGTQTDLASAALRALFNPGQGRSTCIGAEGRTGARDAAMLNAIFANALDFDDDNGVGHPSATVLPAALAAAEEQQASGASLLLGYVAGYEVSSRVGRAIWPSPARYEVVWGVGTHQVFGAAAATAKLYALEKEEILHAFGIAGSAAAVPSALKWNWERRPLGWVKDAVAWPAHAGVMSGMLAREGFAAARDILDGPHGFWVMASSDRFDPSAITQGLGERWLVAQSATKPFPSCRMTHSMLEALQRLVRTHRLVPEQVDTVTVRSISDLSEYLSHPEPTSSVDAQFSACFTAALVVLGVPPGPDWFSSETLRSARVRDLAHRVRLVSDPQADRDYHANVTNIAAEVTVRTHDGRDLVACVSFPRGEPENPIPDGEVREKFLGLADPVIGGQAASRVVELVEEIENLSEVADLTACLRPSR